MWRLTESTESSGLSGHCRSDCFFSFFVFLFAWLPFVVVNKGLTWPITGILKYTHHCREKREESKTSEIPTKRLWNRPKWARNTPPKRRWNKDRGPWTSEGEIRTVVLRTKGWIKLQHKHMIMIDYVLVLIKYAYDSSYHTNTQRSNKNLCTTEASNSYKSKAEVKRLRQTSKTKGLKQIIQRQSSVSKSLEQHVCHKSQTYSDIFIVVVVHSS